MKYKKPKPRLSKRGRRNGLSPKKKIGLERLSPKNGKKANWLSSRKKETTKRFLPRKSAQKRLLPKSEEKPKPLSPLKRKKKPKRSAPKERRPRRGLPRSG